MAIVSAGYDGTVDEVQFAKLLKRYSVVGAADFAASTIAGDRMVSIPGGTALGPGTVDVASDLAPIQFASAGTGTRWDMVVLRRDWQPPGGLTELRIIQGGGVKALPAVGTSDGAWNRRPGIRDDQPLYLQEVKGNILGERVDLRCWAANGGLAAADSFAKAYLNEPGTSLTVGDTVWQYLPGDNGVFGWVASAVPPTYLSPLSPSTAYANTGRVEVDGRRRLVDVTVTRKSTASNLTLSTSYSDFGAVIPVAARTDTEHVRYLASWIRGGGFNVACNVRVNMGTGVVSLRLQSGTAVADEGFSFDVNCAVLDY
ncbi:hypothetical protein D6T65_04965 [Arthrobacter frigidicola]|nr:hypothetical protein D6T65_04965 [Arthrobacter frigidicola]